MKSNSGFTLIEVMLVLVILAGLTVLSSQTMQQAIRNKIKLQNQLDEVSQVRDALKIMEKDINLAFHYRDVQDELRAAIKKRRTEIAKELAGPGSPTTTTMPGTLSLDPLNDPNDPLNQPTPNKVSPQTQFIGSD